MELSWELSRRRLQPFKAAYLIVAPLIEGPMPEPSESEIIADIKRVAHSNGIGPGDRFGLGEYLQQGGQYSHHQLYDGGKTWGVLCAKAGFSTKEKRAITDDACFANLVRAVEELGRYPKASERKKYHLNFSKRRYPNLTAFIECAIERGQVPDLREANTPEMSDAHAVPERPAIVPVPAVTSEVRSVPPIPAQTRRRKWERTNVDGFPYAPQDESGVVALFAILCATRRINWQIVEINGGKGIDVKCFDHGTGKEIVVELKHVFSRSNWNHSVDEIDYVVCWENRWKDFLKPVIELRKILTAGAEYGA